MKKMYLVLIAAAMAFSFSAFTTAEKKSFDTINYQQPNGSGGFTWVEYKGEPCPGDDVNECYKPIFPYGNLRLFYNSNTATPVWRDLP